LAFATVTLVNVATGPPPPPPPAPPPPQPMAKLNAQSRLSPATLQCRFLPGRNSSAIAATPMHPLMPHHPFPPCPETIPAAWKSRSRLASDAERVADVARMATVIWPVAPVLPFGTVIIKGEFGHETPGGSADGQLTVTCPVNPPLAVTVTVELWLAPVDEFNVTALSDTAIPGTIGAVTVKFTEFE